MKFIGRTHVGRIRKNNEDAYAFDAEFEVAVLADGMGGQIWQHPFGKLIFYSVGREGQRPYMAASEAVGHPSIPLALLTVDHAVVWLVAVVAPQASGKGIDIVLTADRTGLTGAVLPLPYFLASAPQRADLTGDFMSTLNHFLIGLVAVVDELAYVEGVVEGGNDGAFGKGSILGGLVSLGVQGLGQGPK